MNAAIAATLNRHGHLVVLVALALATWSGAALLVDGFATGGQLAQHPASGRGARYRRCGQTVVIISGGIDLSIPWMTSVAAVLLTYLSRG